MRLDLDKLAFGYGQRSIGRDVSFAAAPGQVVNLLGANGSGKTTLLKTILGLLRPLGGSIQLDGQDTGSWPRHRIAHAMAYVPQAQRVGFPYSVRQLVLMGRAIHLGPFARPSASDEEAAQQALDRLGIGHMSDRLFPELSGGEQQLVLVARAFAQGSPILVMDEPVASLDLGNQAIVLQAVRQLAVAGRTCLMSTHNPDHAFLLADTVVLLSRGQLVGYGPPPDVISSAALKQLYGVEVDITYVPELGRHLCSTSFQPREVNHEAQRPQHP